MDTEAIEICVKIPFYSDKLQFVTINIENVDKNDFVKKSLEVFHVPNNSQGLQVRLSDNRNASIPERKLAQILKQFHRCASFFVQIEFIQNPTDHLVPSIVTPEMIKLYIEKNGGASVFEYLDSIHDGDADCIINRLSINSDDTDNAHHNVLPTHLRIVFVNCLADYTVSLYGSNPLRPTDYRLKNIARSAVALIPSLASKSSDSETDLLVNQLGGGGGYLYNRLRYLRNKKQDKCKNNLQTFPETEELAPSAHTDNQIVDDTSGDVIDDGQASYQMDDLLFLKTVVVNDQNMPKIHKILKKTLERRRALLNTENVNMLEHFPFMFVHPPLIIDDALPDLHKIKNDYPCIIACGSKPDHISQYIIAIDNQSMYVPKEFSFEETVDLFFKMHYVLSLEFDPRLENVFLFMEHYIYKMEGGTKKPYTTMIELSSLII